MLPFCLEEGVGVIPYNPIAGGLLSGKHDRSEAPPEGSRFTLGNAGRIYQHRYWHDREFDTVDELGALAKQAGVSLVTLAVAWVLANPAITAPIIGASRPDQLDASLAAADYGSTRTSSAGSTRSPTSTAWETPPLTRGAPADQGRTPLIPGHTQMRPPGQIRRARELPARSGLLLLACVGVEPLQFVAVDLAHGPRRERALEEPADAPGAIPAGGELHRGLFLPLGRTVQVVTRLELVSDSVMTRPGSGSATVIR